MPTVATPLQTVAGRSSEAPPDRIRLPFSFDASGLKTSLNAYSEEDWIDHFNHSGYEGIWKILPLRGPAGANHPILQSTSNPGVTQWEDTQFLDRAPDLRAVLEAFECPLTSVRLLSLAPGSRILEHRDPELGFRDGFARIHVPVQTAPEVEFVLNQQRVVMKEGECWYLRLSDPHHVANLSPVPRIHLILDCVINDWLTQFLISNS